MSELHLPWIELALVTLLLGAAYLSRIRDPETAHRRSIFFTGLTLLLTICEWIDFSTLPDFEVHEHWGMLSHFLGPDFAVLDGLSAPLLPVAALLFCLTSIVTLRTKVRRFPFAGTLISEAILLATLSCKQPWGIVLLLAAGAIPPWLELRSRKKPTGVFTLHMAVFVGLLVSGLSLYQFGPEALRPVAVVLLGAAILLRSGVAPVHCWMSDLFEHASFGTALLFITPMIGMYAAVRLLLPIAPDWALHWIAVLSLMTAVYAAGMALVQREARRFFCYLFLSHSSLVLVGLESATTLGVTASFSLWLSISLTLTGFGLALRSLESRAGRLSLTEFHGFYAHTPSLAAFFLLTGLASVGFPGAFGFVGVELLVEGALQINPVAGMVVVIVAALNGIAVVQTYFRLFNGSRHVTSVCLKLRTRERVAVFAITLIILGGGLYPQPGITSRNNAAIEIISHRQDSAVNLASNRWSNRPKNRQTANRAVDLHTD